MDTSINSRYNLKLLRLLIWVIFLIPNVVYCQHKSFRQLLNKNAQSDTEWYGYKVYADDYTHRNDFSYHWGTKPENYNLFDYIKDEGLIDGIYANIVEGIIDRRFYRDERRNLQNFLSQIDSLNVINYENDTIYLFQYDGEFLLESRGHYVAKGQEYWSPNRQKFVRNHDTIVHRFKDTTQFRVSWLPIYMRNALVDEDFDLLTTMCSWYEQQESQWLGGGGYYSPDPHFVYYKIVINDGKIVNRTKFDFEFHDKMYNLLDDIYNEVERLKSEGKVLKLNKIDERRTNFKNGIGEILDSLYREAPYYKILEHNPQILKWEEDYVLPLIDSLNLIDYSNDTIYYELCYSKNGLGKNRAKILTNTKHMYLYESFIGIVWDTLCVSDIDKYMGLSDNFITTMQERYVLYAPPAFPYSSLFLNRMTFDWRTYYYYKYSAPFKYVNDGYLIDSLNVAKQHVKLKRGNMGVCIRSRIEFKDGKVSDVVTQMRLDDNGIW